MELSEAEYQTLFGEAENFEHHHPKLPSDVRDLREIDDITEPVPITTDYTLTENDVFVSIDTSAGNVNITLPAAAAGLGYYITKVSPTGVINVLPESGETVLGKVGISITAQWTTLHLKADDGNWIAV